MGDSLKAFYKYSLDVYLPKLIHSHLIQRRLKSHMEVRADFKIMPSEMAVAISGRGWIILLQKGNNEEPVHLSLKLPLLPKVEKGHWSHFYLVWSAESCSFLSSRTMKIAKFYEFYLIWSAESHLLVIQNDENVELLWVLSRLFCQILQLLQTAEKLQPRKATSHALPSARPPTCCVWRNPLLISSNMWQNLLWYFVSFRMCGLGLGVVGLPDSPGRPSVMPITHVCCRIRC